MTWPTHLPGQTSSANPVPELDLGNHVVKPETDIIELEFFGAAPAHGLSAAPGTNSPDKN